MKEWPPKILCKYGPLFYAKFLVLLAKLFANIFFNSRPSFVFFARWADDRARIKTSRAKSLIARKDLEHNEVAVIKTDRLWADSDAVVVVPAAVAAAAVVLLCDENPF